LGVHRSPSNGGQDHRDPHGDGAAEKRAAFRHGEIFSPLFSWVWKVFGRQNLFVHSATNRVVFSGERRARLAAREKTA
jgi:hypothetical protein